MSIHKRIRERRLAKGLKSHQALAELVGVAWQTVQQWEKDGGTAPNRSRIDKVAEVLGVTVEWLRTGQGSAEPGNIEPGPTIKSDREYPLISWVEAGQWTELCDNFQPGSAEEWKPCHKDLGECGYVLRVKGFSMTAGDGASLTFPEGILLYVNPDAEPLPGKYVIVRRKNSSEATFKKLTMVDGEPYLEAINPNWPNRYLKLEEGDVFCGVVVHAGFDMP